MAAGPHGFVCEDVGAQVARIEQVRRGEERVRERGIKSAMRIAVARGRAERLERHPEARAGHLAPVDRAAQGHRIVATADVARGHAAYSLQMQERRMVW